MRTFVVPDVHGNRALLLRLLEAAEVPPTRAAREAAGVRCVHLGDLANCVYDSVGDDLDVLRVARDLFDAVLLGNHEAPYLGLGRFSGFHHDSDVEAAIGALVADGTVRHAPDGTFHVNLDVGGGKGSGRLVGLWLDEDGTLGDPFTDCFVDATLDAA